MANYGFEMLRRWTIRSKEIVDKAEDTTIKIAGEDVVATAQQFEDRDQQVNALMTTTAKEMLERDSAISKLATVYDKTCSALLVKMPYATLPGRASSLNTPDDKLAGAELVEDLLARIAGVDENHPEPGDAPTGEAWAQDLMKQLAPAVDAATKEFNEAVRSSEDLQKAQAARAGTKFELERKLLGFKRLVRDVFGSHSREYHSLRERLSRDEAPEPVPAE